MNLSCCLYREPNEQLIQLAQLSGNVAIDESSYFCGYMKKVENKHGN